MSESTRPWDIREGMRILVRVNDVDKLMVADYVGESDGFGAFPIQMHAEDQSVDMDLFYTGNAESPPHPEG